MAGMAIGSGFLALTCLLQISFGERQPLQDFLRKKVICFYVLLSVFLFFTAFISLVSAHWDPPLGIAREGFRELKKFHYFLIPLFVAYAIQLEKKSLLHPAFWHSWRIGLLLCTLLAISQYWGSYLFPEAWLENRFFRPIITSLEPRHFHAQGIMFFHLSFASCMSFGVTAALARLLWSPPQETSRSRMLWALIFCACVLSVYLSFSRIALVSLLVSIIFLGFLRMPKIGLIMALLTTIIGATVWTASPVLQKRFSLGTVTMNEREGMWASALEIAKERPWTGVGFARSGGYSGLYLERLTGIKTSFASHAHNNILDIIASIGFIGLFSFLLWWIFLFLIAIRSYKTAAPQERWLAAAILGALIAFHCNGLTQVNFWDGKSQHTLMIWIGLLLALNWKRFPNAQES